jgi:hypothetical protein
MVAGLLVVTVEIFLNRAVDDFRSTAADAERMALQPLQELRIDADAER